MESKREARLDISDNFKLFADLSKTRTRPSDVEDIASNATHRYPPSSKHNAKDASQNDKRMAEMQYQIASRGTSIVAESYEEPEIHDKTDESESGYIVASPVKVTPIMVDMRYDRASEVSAAGCVELSSRRIEKLVKSYEEDNDLEEIDKDHRALVEIYPKILEFNVENPDKESLVTFHLSNLLQDSMEIYKIKTTNPYLFKISPSAGYLFPNEKVEIKTILLEGVDVKNDKLLVIVAAVPESLQVYKMSEQELTKLWKTRAVWKWNSLYQEKIGCISSGSFRQRSKVLMNAFETSVTKDRPADYYHKDSSTQWEKEDEDHKVTRDLSGESWCSNSSGRDQNLAVIKYQSNSNANTQPQLEVWLEMAPEDQARVVEELFWFLHSLRNEASAITIRLDDMENQMSDTAKLAESVTVKHCAISRQVESLSALVSEINRRNSDRSSNLSLEKVRAYVQKEVEKLTESVEALLHQHERIQAKLDEHSERIHHIDTPSRLNRNHNHRSEEYQEEKTPNNSNQNASHNNDCSVEHHVFYDGSRAQDRRLQELERNTCSLGAQMTDISGYVTGLNRRTQAMTDILKNLTGELNQQRRDVHSDTSRLERKYLESCNLLPLQQLGQQNQELLNTMYSGFMSHLEKVSQTLETQIIQQRKLSHNLDHQTLDYQRVKKAVCEMGKCIEREHCKTIKTTGCIKRMFDQLEVKHELLQTHMKDIHCALRNLMGKVAAIAQRVDGIGQEFKDHRVESRKQIDLVRSASMVAINEKQYSDETKISALNSRINELITRIQEIADDFQVQVSSLGELRDAVKDVQEKTPARLAELDDRLSRQIDEFLQCSRREFEQLKHDLFMVQNEMKGMDCLVISGSEKLKALYSDLERFKRSFADELNKLSKHLIDISAEQMKEAYKELNALQAKMDDILSTMTQPHVDFHALEQRMDDIQRDIEDRFAKILKQIQADDGTAGSAEREAKLDQLQREANKLVADLQRAIDNIVDSSDDLQANMNDLENRVQLRIDELASRLDTMGESSQDKPHDIMEEFYCKMRKQAREAANMIEEMEQSLMDMLEERLEEIDESRLHGDKRALQCMLESLDVNDSLTEGVQSQLDKNFYILIILVLLLPLFIYSIYSVQPMNSEYHSSGSWWSNCFSKQGSNSAHQNGLRRYRDEL